MNKKINLVLGGSGTELFYYIGAIEALLHKGFEIANIIGCSGGAIAGAFFACGKYKPNEIKDIISGLDFQKLQDKNLLPFVFNDPKMGLIKGNKILNFFQKYLPNKFIDYTIPFTIVGGNLTHQKTEYFNYYHDIDLSVPELLRISMSIPFLFNNVSRNNQVYIDGGVFNNYPIDYFKDDINTIGLKTIDIINSENITKSLYNYSNAVLSASLAAQENKHLQDAPNAKNIFIKTDFDSLSFEFTNNQIKNMIKSGYNQVFDYVENNINGK